MAYVRSFSKTLSGGLRCGFVSAEPHIVQALAALTLDSSFGLNSLTSLVVFKLLESGQYRRHLSLLKNSISQMQLDAMNQLQDMGFEIPIVPEGGLFIWARWTGMADASFIADVARKKPVLLASGPSFCPTGDFGQYLRFNCTLTRSKGFWKLFREILDEAERLVSQNTSPLAAIK